MHAAALISMHAPAPSKHPHAGVRKRELCVEFQELGLRLRSCGKTVLHGVTGALKAAHITAIMGPSGAPSDWLAHCQKAGCTVARHTAGPARPRD